MRSILAAKSFSVAFSAEVLFVLSHFGRLEGFLAFAALKGSSLFGVKKLKSSLYLRFNFVVFLAH